MRLTLISGGGKGDGNVAFAEARTESVDKGGANPKWGKDLLLPYSEPALGLRAPAKKNTAPRTPRFYPAYDVPERTAAKKAHVVRADSSALRTSCV